MNGRQPGPLFASEAEAGIGGGIRGEVKAGVESNVESNVGGGVEARGGVGDEACVAVAAASDSGASLIGITVRPQSTDVNHPDKSPGEEGKNRDTGISEAAVAQTAVLVLLVPEPLFSHFCCLSCLLRLLLPGLMCFGCRPRPPF